MERIACLFIGYLFGMFQTSYLIGKYHHMDIRQYGSGNAGTTNALRTLGKKAGAMTLIGDMLKCVIAILVVDAVFKNQYGDILPLLGMYTAAGCVLGHNFPIYLKFRGGKGIAASAGMLLALDWRVFLICAVIFIGLVAVIDAILTRENVSRIKPDPEVYHLALETLGVRADEARVFEDSLPGLRAAHAAGIQTVVVRDPWSEADRARLLEEADAHVDSLCDAPEICGFTRS